MASQYVERAAHATETGLQHTRARCGTRGLRGSGRRRRVEQRRAERVATAFARAAVARVIGVMSAVLACYAAHVAVDYNSVRGLAAHVATLP